MIAGLVLAAGAGERFGGRKQLAQLDGRPLLEHVLATMARAPLDSTLVVLGAHAEEVLDGVPMHGARPVVCEGWAEGVAASLRAGIGALPDECEAAVIVLGDQPLLSADAVARVVDQRDRRALAVRATYGGEPGHPVVVERVLFSRLRSLRGDTGARAVLDTVAVREVACDGLGRPDDVDTVAALGALRGEQ